MRDFQLLEPTSPAEASRMLANSGEDCRLFAGGTALLLAMRQRVITPSHIVYLAGVPGLGGITYNEGIGLRIGALVHHAEIADSVVVKARYPMLADMAGQVANPQIRKVATVGGNLCYGDPSTDPPTCLLALGARVIAVSPDGEREIALDEFFVDYCETILQPIEVVTEIRVPPPAEGAVGAYTRFRRNAAEHRPLVGLAVSGRRHRETCSDLRIAIGASTVTPVRARLAEEFLEGKSISCEHFEQAADLAAGEVSPISDLRAGADYRREMVRVLTRRTLTRAFVLDAELCP